MRPEAHIAAYGKAFPPLVETEKIAELMAEELRKGGQSEGTIRKMNFMCRSTKIRSRPMSLTKFHIGTDAEKKMFLGKPIGQYWKAEIAATEQNRDLTAEERSDLWREIAPKLALEAAQNAMKKWSGTPADITHVVTTNTSGWREPGIASYLIHGLGLPLSTQKAELNFNGCFCGMTCLRLARDIVRAGDDSERRAVLVVGTELASLHWSRDADDMNLLASSLFSDGSSAFIVSTEGPWRFKDAGMSLVPDSSELLELDPFAPAGEPQMNGAYRMKLSPKVAGAIASYFAEGMGGEKLKKIMEQHCPGDTKPDLAVHPGGPRILESLNDVLIGTFDFDPAILDGSNEVLHEYGNLGSTAILYVLDNVLTKSTKQHVVSMAFGPGVTFEWGAFERA